jgi:hypothetical protein
MDTTHVLQTRLDSRGEGHMGFLWSNARYSTRVTAGDDDE